MGSSHKVRANSFSEVELNMREVSELFMSWKQKNEPRRDEDRPAV